MSDVKEMKIKVLKLSAVVLSCVALLVGVFALAGCSGQDTAKQEQEYNQQITDLYSELSKVFTDLTNALKSQDVDGLKKVTEKLKEASEKLDSMKVPDSYKEIHSKLSEAVKLTYEASDELTQAVEQLKKGTMTSADFQKKAQDIQKKVKDAQSSAQEAQKLFKEKTAS